MLTLGSRSLFSGLQRQTARTTMFVLACAAAVFGWMAQSDGTESNASNMLAYGLWIFAGFSALMSEPAHRYIDRPAAKNDEIERKTKTVKKLVVMLVMIAETDLQQTMVKEALASQKKAGPNQRELDHGQQDSIREKLESVAAAYALFDVTQEEDFHPGMLHGVNNKNNTFAAMTRIIADNYDALNIEDDTFENLLSLSDRELRHKIRELSNADLADFSKKLCHTLGDANVCTSFPNVKDIRRTAQVAALGTGFKLQSTSNGMEVTLQRVHPGFRSFITTYFPTFNALTGKLDEVVFNTDNADPNPKVSPSVVDVHTYQQYAIARLDDASITTPDELQTHFHGLDNPFRRGINDSKHEPRSVYLYQSTLMGDDAALFRRQMIAGLLYDETMPPPVVLGYPEDVNVMAYGLHKEAKGFDPSVSLFTEYDDARYAIIEARQACLLSEAVATKTSDATDVALMAYAHAQSIHSAAGHDGKNIPVVIAFVTQQSDGTLQLHDKKVYGDLSALENKENALVVCVEVDPAPNTSKGYVRKDGDDGYIWIPPVSADMSQAENLYFGTFGMYQETRHGENLLQKTCSLRAFLLDTQHNTPDKTYGQAKKTYEHLKQTARNYQTRKDFSTVLALQDVAVARRERLKALARTAVEQKFEVPAVENNLGTVAIGDAAQGLDITAQDNHKPVALQADYQGGIAYAADGNSQGRHTRAPIAAGDQHNLSQVILRLFKDLRGYANVFKVGSDATSQQKYYSKKDMMALAVNIIHFFKGENEVDLSRLSAKYLHFEEVVGNDPKDQTLTEKDAHAFVMACIESQIEDPEKISISQADYVAMVGYTESLARLHCLGLTLKDPDAPLPTADQIAKTLFAAFNFMLPQTNAPIAVLNRAGQSDVAYAGLAPGGVLTVFDYGIAGTELIFPIPLAGSPQEKIEASVRNVKAILNALSVVDLLKPQDRTAFKSISQLRSEQFAGALAGKLIKMIGDDPSEAGPSNVLMTIPDAWKEAVGDNHISKDKLKNIIKYAGTTKNPSVGGGADLPHPDFSFFKDLIQLVIVHATQVAPSQSLEHQIKVVAPLPLDEFKKDTLEQQEPEALIDTLEVKSQDKLLSWLGYSLQEPVAHYDDAIRQLFAADRKAVPLCFQGHEGSSNDNNHKDALFRINGSILPEEKTAAIIRTRFLKREVNLGSNGVLGSKLIPITMDHLDYLRADHAAHQPLQWTDNAKQFLAQVIQRGQMAKIWLKRDELPHKILPKDLRQLADAQRALSHGQQPDGVMISEAHLRIAAEPSDPYHKGLYAILKFVYLATPELEDWLLNFADQPLMLQEHLQARLKDFYIISAAAGAEHRLIQYLSDSFEENILGKIHQSDKPELIRFELANYYYGMYLLKQSTLGMAAINVHRIAAGHDEIAQYQQGEKAHLAALAECYEQAVDGLSLACRHLLDDKEIRNHKELKQKIKAILGELHDKELGIIQEINHEDDGLIDRIVAHFRFMQQFNQQVSIGRAIGLQLMAEQLRKVLDKTAQLEDPSLNVRMERKQIIKTVLARLLTRQLLHTQGFLAEQDLDKLIYNQLLELQLLGIVSAEQGSAIYADLLADSDFKKLQVKINISLFEVEDEKQQQTQALEHISDYLAGQVAKYYDKHCADNLKYKETKEAATDEEKDRGLRLSLPWALAYHHSDVGFDAEHEVKGDKADASIAQKQSAFIAAFIRECVRVEAGVMRATQRFPMLAHLTDSQIAQLAQTIQNKFYDNPPGVAVGGLVAQDNEVVVRRTLMEATFDALHLIQDHYSHVLIRKEPMTVAVDDFDFAGYPIAKYEGQVNSAKFTLFKQAPNADPEFKQEQSYLHFLKATGLICLSIDTTGDEAADIITRLKHNYINKAVAQASSPTSQAQLSALHTVVAERENQFRSLLQVIHNKQRALKHVFGGKAAFRDAIRAYLLAPDKASEALLTLLKADATELFSGPNPPEDKDVLSLIQSLAKAARFPQRHPVMTKWIQIYNLKPEEFLYAPDKLKVNRLSADETKQSESDKSPSVEFIMRDFLSATRLKMKLSAADVSYAGIDLSSSQFSTRMEDMQQLLTITMTRLGAISAMSEFEKKQLKTFRDKHQLTGIDPFMRFCLPLESREKPTWEIASLTALEAATMARVLGQEIEDKDSSSGFELLFRHFKLVDLFKRRGIENPYFAPAYLLGGLKQPSDSSLTNGQKQKLIKLQKSFSKSPQAIAVYIKMLMLGRLYAETLSQAVNKMIQQVKDPHFQLSELDYMKLVCAAHAEYAKLQAELALNDDLAPELKQHLEMQIVWRFQFITQQCLERLMSAEALIDAKLNLSLVYGKDPVMPGHTWLSKGVPSRLQDRSDMMPDMLEAKNAPYLREGSPAFRLGVNAGSLQAFLRQKDLLTFTHALAKLQRLYAEPKDAVDPKEKQYLCAMLNYLMKEKLFKDSDSTETIIAALCTVQATFNNLEHYQDEWVEVDKLASVQGRISHNKLREIVKRVLEETGAMAQESDINQILYNQPRAADDPDALRDIFARLADRGSPQQKVLKQLLFYYLCFNAVQNHVEKISLQGLLAKCIKLSLRDHVRASAAIISDYERQAMLLTYHDRNESLDSALSVDVFGSSNILDKGQDGKDVRKALALSKVPVYLEALRARAARLQDLAPEATIIAFSELMRHAQLALPQDRNEIHLALAQGLWSFFPTTSLTYPDFSTIQQIRARCEAQYPAPTGGETALEKSERQERIEKEMVGQIFQNYLVARIEQECRVANNTEGHFHALLRSNFQINVDLFQAFGLNQAHASSATGSIRPTQPQGGNQEQREQDTRIRQIQYRALNLALLRLGLIVELDLTKNLQQQLTLGHADSALWENNGAGGLAAAPVANVGLDVLKDYKAEYQEKKSVYYNGLAATVGVKATQGKVKITSAVEEKEQLTDGREPIYFIEEADVSAMMRTALLAEKTAWVADNPFDSFMVPNRKQAPKEEKNTEEKTVPVPEVNPLQFSVDFHVVQANAAGGAPTSRVASENTPVYAMLTGLVRTLSYAREDLAATPFASFSARDKANGEWLATFYEKAITATYAETLTEDHVKFLCEQLLTLSPQISFTFQGINKDSSEEVRNTALSQYLAQLEAENIEEPGTQIDTPQTTTTTRPRTPQEARHEACLQLLKGYASAAYDIDMKLNQVVRMIHSYRKHVNKPQSKEAIKIALLRALADFTDALNDGTDQSSKKAYAHYAWVLNQAVLEADFDHDLNMVLVAPIAVNNIDSLDAFKQAAQSLCERFADRYVLCREKYQALAAPHEDDIIIDQNKIERDNRRRVVGTRSRFRTYDTPDGDQTAALRYDHFHRSTELGSDTLNPQEAHALDALLSSGDPSKVDTYLNKLMQTRKRVFDFYEMKQDGSAQTTSVSTSGSRDTSGCSAAATNAVAVDSLLKVQSDMQMAGYHRSLCQVAGASVRDSVFDQPFQNQSDVHGLVYALVQQVPAEHVLITLQQVWMQTLPVYQGEQQFLTLPNSFRQGIGADAAAKKQRYEETRKVIGEALSVFKAKLQYTPPTQLSAAANNKLSTSIDEALPSIVHTLANAQERTVEAFLTGKQIEDAKLYDEAKQDDTSLEALSEQARHEIHFLDPQVKNYLLRVDEDPRSMVIKAKEVIDFIHDSSRTGSLPDPIRRALTRGQGEYADVSRKTMEILAARLGDGLVYALTNQFEKMVRDFSFDAQDGTPRKGLISITPGHLLRCVLAIGEIKHDMDLSAAFSPAHDEFTKVRFALKQRAALLALHFKDLQKAQLAKVKNSQAEIDKQQARITSITRRLADLRSGGAHNNKHVISVCEQEQVHAQSTMFSLQKVHEKLVSRWHEIRGFYALSLIEIDTWSRHVERLHNLMGEMQLQMRILLEDTETRSVAEREILQQDCQAMREQFFKAYVSGELLSPENASMREHQIKIPTYTEVEEMLTAAGAAHSLVAKYARYQDIDPNLYQALQDNETAASIRKILIEFNDRHLEVNAHGGLTSIKANNPDGIQDGIYALYCLFHKNGAFSPENIENTQAALRELQGIIKQLSIKKEKTPEEDTMLDNAIALANNMQSFITDVYESDIVQQYAGAAFEMMSGRGTPVTQVSTGSAICAVRNTLAIAANHVTKQGNNLAPQILQGDNITQLTLEEKACKKWADLADQHCDNMFKQFESVDSNGTLDMSDAKKCFTTKVRVNDSSEPGKTKEVPVVFKVERKTDSDGRESTHVTRDVQTTTCSEAEKRMISKKLQHSPALLATLLIEKRIKMDHAGRENIPVRMTFKATDEMKEVSLRTLERCAGNSAFDITRMVLNVNQEEWAFHESQGTFVLVYRNDETGNLDTDRLNTALLKEQQLKDLYLSWRSRQEVEHTLANDSKTLGLSSMASEAPAAMSSSLSQQWTEQAKDVLSRHCEGSSSRVMTPSMGASPAA